MATRQLSGDPHQWRVVAYISFLCFEAAIGAYFPTIASLRAEISAVTNNAGVGSMISPEAASIPTFQNKCPRGHDLRADVYSEVTHQLQPQCSGCGSEIATAGFIWRCRENCDFKLCDNCRFGR